MVRSSISTRVREGEWLFRDREYRVSGKFQCCYSFDDTDPHLAGTFYITNGLSPISPSQGRDYKSQNLLSFFRQNERKFWRVLYLSVLILSYSGPRGCYGFFAPSYFTTVYYDGLGVYLGKVVGFGYDTTTISNCYRSRMRFSLRRCLTISGRSYHSIILLDWWSLSVGIV